MKHIIKTSLTIMLFFLTVQFAVGQPKIKKTPPVAQTTIKNTPLGNQLKEIFANAPSGYKKLRFGKGEVKYSDTVYTSNLNIERSEECTIIVGTNTRYHCVVTGFINGPEATVLFNKWSKDISDALGADFDVKRETRAENNTLSIYDIFTDTNHHKTITLKNFSYSGGNSIDIDIRVH